MANTYTQLYIHVVFAVKGRANVISKSWRDQLYQYITGIVKNKNQKLMIINGVGDHLHILLSLKPDCILSELIRDIKSNSSKWVNDNGYVMGKFEWQSGFGAFSLGATQLIALTNYIKNQEEHHHKKTFREEYIEFLKDYEIDFKSEYIFEDLGGTPDGAD
jgi:REP element-mobilizing transposase RayT